MRKAAKHTIVILLLLTLSISTAFLIYLHFFAPNNDDLSGEWTADLNMTKQAAVTAFIWLQDIEGVSVSLEDIESYMQDLSVQVELNLKQTARDNGSFSSNVLPESYEDCRQAAYETFAMVFQEVLVERLLMAGYKESIDEEGIEALVSETFGMSTVSYLMTYGPQLLPPFEELQEQYDSSGTYEVLEGILIRQFNDGQFTETKEEWYIRKDSCLILAGENNPGMETSLSDLYPIIYTLKQP